MSALVYGGRSPIALEICKQLAGVGHEVHLVTRILDDAITKLAKENDCVEVHDCDLEDSVKSIELALKINSRVGGLDAVAFAHRYRSEVAAPLKQYSVEVYTPYEILKALAASQRSKQCAVVLLTSPAAHSVVGDQDFQ